MHSSCREEIAAVLDELDADLDRACELSFDPLNHAGAVANLGAPGKAHAAAAHNSLFVAYRISADLLARDYNDLIAMPPPVGNTPHTGSIRRPR